MAKSTVIEGNATVIGYGSIDNYPTPYETSYIDINFDGSVYRWVSNASASWQCDNYPVHIRAFVRNDSNKLFRVAISEAK